MMQRVVDYLAMGGYAGFVWPAYGVTAVVMVGLLVSSVRSYRARSRELDRLQDGREGRRR
jgi:heme exporter protein D